MFHFIRHLDDQLLVAAVEKHLRVAHRVRVVCVVNLAHTGAGAASNLILEARSRAISKVAVFALPDMENLLQKIEAVAHRPGTGIRSVVLALRFTRAAMKTEARIRMLRT